MNRGLSQRSIFETRLDMRAFEALLARAARARLLELHAHSLLTNHYHLLVRTEKGTLSAAMAWIQREYVRWFNRSRGRRGPLFEGRFTSKVANSRAYRAIALRYIDDNPVAAGIVPRSPDYPYSSVWRLARGKRAPWLTRDWVRLEVEQIRRPAEPFFQAYERRFPSDLSPEIRAWVARRFDSRYANETRDDFADLLRAAPEAVRAWLQDRSREADGTSAGLPVAAAGLVVTSWEDLRKEMGPWVIPRGRRHFPLDGWDGLLAGLLRDLAGLSLKEIAARVARPVTTVHAGLAVHRTLMVEDPVYSHRGSLVACETMRRMAAGEARAGDSSLPVPGAEPDRRNVKVRSNRPGTATGTT